MSGKEDKTTYYTYDLLGRLTNERETKGGDISYQYDRFGNRAKMTSSNANLKTTATVYSYDQCNKLLTEIKTYDGTTETFWYSYDANGSQTRRQWEKQSPKKDPPEPGAIGFHSKKFNQGVVILETREYNGFGELSYLYRDMLETRYQYRPDGLRFKKIFADGTSASHIWDGQNLIAEYGANGSVHSRYIRGTNLIARDQDNQLQYYLHNAHGDIIERTSPNGTTLKNYDYDAFGVEQTPEELDANPFRYCGEYYDREAETYYLRARNYCPRTGRFSREDSAHDGLNWYTYCGNNPVKYYDPTGCYYVVRDRYSEYGNYSGTYSLHKDTFTAAVGSSLMSRLRIGGVLADNIVPSSVPNDIVSGSSYNHLDLDKIVDAVLSEAGGTGLEMIAEGIGKVAQNALKYHSYVDTISHFADRMDIVGHDEILFDMMDAFGLQTTGFRSQTAAEVQITRLNRLIAKNKEYFNPNFFRGESAYRIDRKIATAKDPSKMIDKLSSQYADIRGGRRGSDRWLMDKSFMQNMYLEGYDKRLTTLDSMYDRTY